MTVTWCAALEGDQCLPVQFCEANPQCDFLEGKQSFLSHSVLKAERAHTCMQGEAALCKHVAL